LNFLSWGIYHGAGLAVCSNYPNVCGRCGSSVADWFACNRLAGRLLTPMFVNVGWLFFFFPLPVAFRMVRLLFGGN
jgi:D-alanyl-lipoteichoic acid acyltransferase DltB (MBOAT superfamily)